MLGPRTSWWLSPAEIARLGLPGFPATARKVRELVAASGWRERVSEDGTPLARQRRARGGGMEYHASLLPLPAQQVLTTLYATTAAPKDVARAALARLSPAERKRFLLDALAAELAR